MFTKMMNSRKNYKVQYLLIEYYFNFAVIGYLIDMI
jgi:hypothetical protein